MLIEERFWAKVNKKGPYPSKQACKVHPEKQVLDAMNGQVA